MASKKTFKFLAFLGVFASTLASAQVMRKSSCLVPLDEKKSSPSIDLITESGTPIDRDTLIDLIRSGQDTSRFNPQRSDLYTGEALPTVSDSKDLPEESEIRDVPFDLVSYTEVDHLTQARILDSRTQTAYRLTVTFDVNAAVARNALLRKLGYAIPSPRLYRKLKVRFKDLDQRDEFLIKISKIRDMGLWVDGGSEEVKKKSLTLTLINVALESSLIGNVPPMHWGIFKPETLQSRRSLRALLVPLSLLDIDESVNMYSFEPAKVDNGNLVFSRVYANSFKNETSLGDVRWMARKIAKLKREDWLSVIRAGHYPADIEALILEKTIARTNHLMALLQIKDFEPLPYQPYLTYGNIINGKATQSRYEGYPQYFSYGDLLNPLRLSEMARYFGIEFISNGIKYALDRADQFLQLLTQEKYVKTHSEKVRNNILEHLQTHPGEPYVQPLEAWGGPVLGGNIQAGRSVIAGTYYGSNSPVQMVDSISVSAHLGAFIGISGIRNIGPSLTPSLSYNRSYVHVRPIPDMKTAVKDSWKNLVVPYTMSKLAKVLLPDEGEEKSKSISKFLEEMKTGEMFIIVDGFTLSNQVSAGIPLGALMGFAPLVSNLSENIGLMNQYGILSRTTLYKTEKGLQVYLTDIRQKTHELSADTNFFIKLFGLTGSKLNGTAETKAFVLPSEFKKEEEQNSFITGIRNLLKWNRSETLESAFQPYQLDHESNGRRARVRIGPWQWTRRETLNRLEITPPVDPEGKYDAASNIRTVVQGQINRVSGTDLYGFLGSVLNRFVSFLNIGGGAKGDDPSSNFLGRSKSVLISTEMETTPNRPNRILSKLQQTYSGWSMKKKRLLKLLGMIEDEIGELNLQDELINEDVFTQTRKVQAYNLVSNLLIDEDGIQNILDLLDQNKTDTRSAIIQMANLMGMPRYKQYCRENSLEIGFKEGPFNPESIENASHYVIETAQTKTTLVLCVLPWMETVFDLRNQLQKHEDIFKRDIHDEETAQTKIKWMNRTLTQLERNLDLSLLIKWAGTDHAYFQVSLAGYRKGDERAQDEEGRSTWFSNTVGSTSSRFRNGPLDEIATTSTINAHEISARYLSDGF